jgi:hypothetical protein
MAVKKNSIKHKRKIIQMVKNLHGLSSKQLRFFVNSVDHKMLHNIADMFYNLNHNSLDLNSTKSKLLFDKMRKNADCCKQIADSKIPIKSRRKLMAKQAGNGLMAIAFSVLAPIIGGLIQSAFNKKK